MSSFWPAVRCICSVSACGALTPVRGSAAAWAWLGLLGFWAAERAGAIAKSANDPEPPLVGDA